MLGVIQNGEMAKDILGPSRVMFRPSSCYRHRY